MTRMALRTLTIVVALSALTVGCCKKQEQQLAALQADYNSLQDQNADLRTQLASAQAGQGQLASDLQAAQLNFRNEQLRRLEAERELAKFKTGPGPEVGPAVEKRGDWEIGRHADRVTVGSDVLFSSGKASLTAKGKAALDKIAGTLKVNYSNNKVLVYGYTDSDPVVKTRNLWQDNLGLSVNRALAVSRYLIEKGVDKDRIETIGMGATNFVASNKTKDGKAQNRRVEIIVLKD